MKKKFNQLLILLFLSSLWVGIYGSVLSQLTFSLSEEYYTKFKFYQFEINPIFQDRIGVTIVGFLSAWWIGLPVGFIIFLQNERLRKSAILRGFQLMIIFAVMTPFLGVLIWYIPSYVNPIEYKSYVFHLPSFVPGDEKIIDIQSFYLAELIQKYSLWGGALGLIGGVLLNVLVRKD